jgi:hypothetical protein
MNLGLLVPVLFLAPCVIIALWQLPKIWNSRAPIQQPEATKRWWPFGEALRYAFLRGLPVGIFSCAALVASMAAVLVEESTSGTVSDLARRAALWAFLVFVCLTLVDVSVTLFNRPKLVVPPAARDEPGAIAMWWRSRRYRPRRRTRRAGNPER